MKVCPRENEKAHKGSRVWTVKAARKHIRRVKESKAPHGLAYCSAIDYLTRKWAE